MASQATTTEWLHFCDFHIKGKTGPHRDALTSLLNKVKEVCSRSTGIHAVFLVGDIAYAGDDESYSEFTRLFLAPLRLLPQLVNAKLFAVPGNHDVFCDDVLPQSWDALADRQSAFFCEDPDGKRARQTRSIGLQKYWKWAEENKLLGPNPLEEVSKLHLLDDLPFDIVTTNTAFLSYRTDDSDKPTTPVPMCSLRSVFDGARPGRPVLVLGHHSPSSFSGHFERPVTSSIKAAPPMP